MLVLQLITTVIKSAKKDKRGMTSGNNKQRKKIIEKKERVCINKHILNL